jgi:CRP/FNR family transcriptional regulator, cyclic AMP receptor protein
MGEISLLDSRPPSATLRTEAVTELLAISFDSLRSKLSRDPPFAARLYQALGTFLAQRLRSVNLQLIVGDGAMVDRMADENEADEIDPEVLEKITLAGSRFKWILEKLGASKGD